MDMKCWRRNTERGKAYYSWTTVHNNYSVHSKFHILGPGICLCVKFSCVSCRSISQVLFPNFRPVAWPEFANWCCGGHKINQYATWHYGVNYDNC